MPRYFVCIGSRGAVASYDGLRTTIDRARRDAISGDLIAIYKALPSAGFGGMIGECVYYAHKRLNGGVRRVGRWE